MAKMIAKRTVSEEMAFPLDFELDFEADFDREREPPRWADARISRSEIIIMINKKYLWDLNFIDFVHFTFQLIIHPIRSNKSISTKYINMNI